MLYQAPQNGIVIPQFLAWLNSLTIPGLLLAAWGLSRWYSKKEQEAKDAYNNILSVFQTMKDNHLTHIEASLSSLNIGQENLVRAIADHKEELLTGQKEMKEAIVAAQTTTKDAIVQSQNLTKDAIVQAILTMTR